jgi:hypothetical protein
MRLASQEPILLRDRPARICEINLHGLTAAMRQLGEIYQSEIAKYGKIAREADISAN